MFKIQTTNGINVSIMSNHVMAVFETETGCGILLVGGMIYESNSSYRSVRGYVSKNAATQTEE